MDAGNATDAAAQATAEVSAQAMWAQDRASKALGMKIERVGPGEAVMSMMVREDMTNGHNICHGGFIFTLADSTFAFACNSYGQYAVAQHCAVTFIQPVRQGETLTAHAVERSRAGRGGIYDITVRDGRGTVVAEFRGHSRTITGRWLATDTNQ
jgi:acyl-CoA thioesterase